MEQMSQLVWHQALADPSNKRSVKPRNTGLTMVIDKGLGYGAFEDLLQTSGAHIDMIKLGFGTSVLYPMDILKKKIACAHAHDICIFPGGTFLEIAVKQDLLSAFFDHIQEIGFSGIEVSDGTISMDRETRNECIRRGLDKNLRVFTEYGKKLLGTSFDWSEMQETVEEDWQRGAELVTMEGRESGTNVGLFDKNGDCEDRDLQRVVSLVSKPQQILWETPLKSQQVQFMKALGADINMGNIASQDIIALEALRRGLRSDTFCLHHEEANPTINMGGKACESMSYQPLQKSK